MLESLLECERTACANLQQNLNTTNDELVQLRKEKFMHDQNYLVAPEKVKEFRVLFQQAQEKIKEVEAELVAEKAAISTTEGLLRKKNKEIRISESALKK